MILFIYLFTLIVHRQGLYCKYALSDFCQMMLIFESTKANTPIPQQDLAPILISLPHTYVHKHGNDNRRNKQRWHTSIFKQKPTQISFETMQNQRYSPIKNKQRNLSVQFGPFPLHEFLSKSSSDIYAGPSSCLIVTLLFNVLFLLYFPLFICHLSLSIVDLLISVLCTQTERSLLSISARHAPYCWLAITSVFWDSVRHCSQKSFSKIA